MKHLVTARIYYKMPNGKLKMKRVSAAYEAQFPRKYRKLLVTNGPTRCTKAIMDDCLLPLAAAWDLLKRACRQEASVDEWAAALATTNN